jgi:hypothetical protein
VVPLSPSPGCRCSDQNNDKYRPLFLCRSLAPCALASVPPSICLFFYCRSFDCRFIASTWLPSCPWLIVVSPSSTDLSSHHRVRVSPSARFALGSGSCLTRYLLFVPFVPSELLRLPPSLLQINEPVASSLLSSISPRASPRLATPVPCASRPSPRHYLPSPPCHHDDYTRPRLFVPSCQRSLALP